MRKLPSKYSEIENSLPQKVVLNKPVKAFYTNPITKKDKEIKIDGNTSFTISAIPNKTFTTDEDAVVETDIVATRLIVNGKNERIYAKFKYKDLVDNGLIIDLVGGKYKIAKRSLLIFGVPREYFIAGIGVLMIAAGVYFLKKKPK